MAFGKEDWSPKVSSDTDSSEDIQFVPKGTTKVFGSPYCLVFQLLMIAVPCVQLVIGAIYRNECNIDEKIPIYLIVSGAVGIGTTLISLVTVEYTDHDWFKKGI